MSELEVSVEAVVDDSAVSLRRLSDSSESELTTALTWSGGAGLLLRRLWGVPASGPTSLPAEGDIMKGGLSFGTLGRGLLSAKFRKPRAASREFDEFRDEDRLAILAHQVSLNCATGVRT